MKAAALTKTIILLFFIVGAINIGTLVTHKNSNQDFLETSQKQAVYKQLGIDLMGASDLLSELARCYVLNGDIVYHDAYFREIEVTKTRESVVARLAEMGAPQNEIELVTLAFELSSALEQLEYRAFEAVADGDFKTAREVMFGESYAEGKQAIINTMNQYQREVDQRIKNEAAAVNAASERSFELNIIINSILMISIIISLFIILRNISADQKLRLAHELRQQKLDAELREAAVTSHEALSRLSAIYSSIPDILFCKDSGGLYTSCNRGFETQAGLPEREIVGKTYAQVFPHRSPDIIAYDHETDKKIISERATNRDEEIIAYPDGSRRKLETLKAPLIQGGEVVGVLGLSRDVTSYREVKDRLERIINTAQVAFLLSVDGIIFEANEYSKVNLGIKTGDPVTAVYADEGQRDLLIRAIRSNEAGRRVIRFNMSGGGTHRFLVNVSSVEYENQNAYIMWAVDVEQDEVKNDQIRVTRESLQTVLDALPIPVRIVDLETNNIVYANDSFVELLGFSSPNDICGLNLRDVLPESSSDGTPSWKLIDRILYTENLVSFEVSYKTKYGRIIETLLSSRHIEYKGRRSSIGIIKDLTAEKEHTRMLMNAAAREKEANQAKSLFLANMSHEIRTPMNGIIGFAELALDDRVTLSAKNDYLMKIRSSGEGLLQIINDILDISKIEAGKLELESIPFNIHEIFRICQTIIMPKALEKGVMLYCYAEPSVGRRLLGDPTRLRQVLLNLLSNAVKFTNVGTVKLLSSIIASSEDTVTISFEVKDSGIGMTPEQISRIFEAFTQADATTTRKYGGTGLGLSITKNIVERMGGKLDVKSEFGIGSKFSFELTFNTVNSAEEIENQPLVFNEYKKPAFKGEILLFEDNQINQQVIHDHLTRVGLKTVIAENGKIGVDIVRNRMERGDKPFDLIFMDIHMPVMDGLEAASKLIELGNQSPVVALTANVMETSKELYRQHGMSVYLAKPFKTQELWACLLKYLNPVDFKEADTRAESEADRKQRLRIQANFAADNQTAFRDIREAIDRNDIKLAHRLAHTLKGLAGLIGGTELLEAARAVETALADGTSRPSPPQMEALERELNAMLAKLASLTEKSTEPEAERLDKESAVTLLDRLDALLSANNTECMDWTDALRGIPGSGGLIEQIESFEFKQARRTLADLKRSL